MVGGLCTVFVCYFQYVVLFFFLCLLLLFDLPLIVSRFVYEQSLLPRWMHSTSHFIIAVLTSIVFACVWAIL